MSTPAERLAVDLRNAYEWHDRQAFEHCLTRLVVMLDGSPAQRAAHKALWDYFRSLYDPGDSACAGPN